MLDHTPVPEFRERWRILTKGGYSEDQLRSSLDSLTFAFGRMDEELARRGPWLAGKTYSLGDISMLAIAHRITQLYPEKLDRKAFPRLGDWWDRSMARPAAKFAYSNDTEETPKRPAKKTVAGITEYHVPA
jgi:glutathione S-transferase